MSKLRLFLRKIRFCIIVPLYHKLLIKRLKHKNEINVVFIASTLSMWRYQGIYELLSKHPRFRVSIALLPFNSYSKEQQKDEIIMLSSYFDSLGIKYYVGDENSRLDVRTQLNPDVLFYPQPYPDCMTTIMNIIILEINCYVIFLMASGSIKLQIGLIMNCYTIMPGSFSIQ